MSPMIRITSDTYKDGVKQFLTSLGWTYVTHRYPTEVQMFLMRALTASKLDPWDWERCIMRLVSQPDDGLARLLTGAWLGITDTVALAQVVECIHAYAQQHGKRLLEPPTAPTYLVEYGYNQQAYLADLEQVYGLPLDLRYLEPWPDASTTSLEQPLLLQPNLLRKAAAMMGDTASIIEQLMIAGGINGRRN